MRDNWYAEHPDMSPVRERKQATKVHLTGTVLWSGQIIPQIYKTHREGTSVGLSPYLM
jgi:PQ loop repeat